MLLTELDFTSLFLTSILLSSLFDSVSRSCSFLMFVGYLAVSFLTTLAEYGAAGSSAIAPSEDDRDPF